MATMCTLQLTTNEADAFGEVLKEAIAYVSQYGNLESLKNIKATFLDEKIEVNDYMLVGMINNIGVVLDNMLTQGLSSYKGHPLAVYQNIASKLSNAYISNFGRSFVQQTNKPYSF
jgi:hypothetical protein